MSVGHGMTQTGSDVISQVTESETEEEKERSPLGLGPSHCLLFNLF